MIRTQIQFEPPQYEQVRLVARRHGISMAEAVRRLVDIGLDHGLQGARRASAADLLALAGIAESGLEDLGGEHDRYLDEDLGP